MKQVFLFLALIFFCTPAFACPVLEEASPKVGSEVKGDIGVIELKFSGQIFPDKSTLKVTDSNGIPVNMGKAYGQPGSNNFIATKVRPLLPGKYKVSWNVFCDCGNLIPGDYKFTVR